MASYSIKVWRSEYGDYWLAEIIDLPGCRSHGKTMAEAIKNVQDAKDDWIANAIKHNDDVPLIYSLEF